MSAICECGRLLEDSIHVRYGNDFDNPTKHVFKEAAQQPRESLSAGTPLCTNCNHPRSEHSEEMPYECMNADMCDCEGFSYIPAASAEKGERVGGAKHPDFDTIVLAHHRLRHLSRKLAFAETGEERLEAAHNLKMFLMKATWSEAMEAESRVAAPAGEQIEGLLCKLRDSGWMVAVHNDYRQDGKLKTFWLFVKDGRAIKGEGDTDREALEQCSALLAAGGKG